MISTLSKKHNFDIVFDSQKIFRLILEAMSYPGRIVSIKECADKLHGENSPLLAVAMTLLDNETSFCAEQPLSDEIAMLTSAKAADPKTADYIFVCGREYLPEAIEKAKCGTPADPHKSATVVAQDTDLLELAKEAIALRGAQNHEYPQGIDIISVSKAGELLAFPRLAGESMIKKHKKEME